MRRVFTIHARDHRIAAGRRTLVMGILNVTPDSFSGDGLLRRSQFRETAIRRGQFLVREGADILDVGGESTRPGAPLVSCDEEIKRVVPVIEGLAQRVKIPISIDTYKPAVARAALEAGASIVNLIKGAPVSAAILPIVRRYKAGLVLMHMRGTPRTMQSKTDYQDFLVDVAGEIKKSVEKCLGNGIKRESLIVDPGIGFSKTAEQNLELIRSLGFFRSLRLPILMGPSRKSFIGKTLGLSVEERLIPTIAAVALCVDKGAHMVRVHDVRAVRQAVDLVDAVLNRC